MLNTILTALLLIFVAVLTWICYRFVSKMNQIYKQFIDFATPKAEGELSELGKLFDNLSHAAGHAVAMEVKTTLMGNASASARQEKAIMGDIATDTINAEHPMLGAALGAFPSLQKRLMKNPALLSALAPLVQKFAQPAGNMAGAGGPDNNHSQVKFKL